MFFDSVVVGFGWRYALTDLSGWKVLSAFLLLVSYDAGKQNQKI
jgi:hypothetical protein